MTPRMLKIIPCAFALALVAGCSDSNNPLAEDTIDTVPPAVPVNVDLQVDPGSALYVQWDSNADADLAGYVVQRSLDEGLSWADATSVITNTEFVDEYYSKAWYRVSAVDISENQSAFSGVVSYLATTGLPKFAQETKGQL